MSVTAAGMIVTGNAPTDEAILAETTGRNLDNAPPDAFGFGWATHSDTEAKMGIAQHSFYLCIFTTNLLPFAGCL
jgi:hypothetical protein